MLGCKSWRTLEVDFADQLDIFARGDGRFVRSSEESENIVCTHVGPRQVVAQQTCWGEEQPSDIGTICACANGDVKRKL